MRILGIDPGYAIVGYGVLDYDGYDFVPRSFGAITTPAGEMFSLRLKTIYDDLTELISDTKPDVMSIEKLYFNTNVTTGIEVAHARGVIVLAAVNSGLPVYEYTPLQVKMSVVGYGNAEKKQVMDMTRRILKLAKTPRPDDTADALAVAICHGHNKTGIEISEKY